MKNCKDFIDRIYLGENSGELREHLSACPRCSARKQEWEILKHARGVLPEVPEALSVNIRNYAANAVQKKKRHFYLKYIWIPAAAALALSFGIVYSSLDATHPAPKTSLRDLAELDSGMDSLDSDLILLTAQLEQTSNRLLGVTVASSTLETSSKNGGLL